MAVNPLTKRVIWTNYQNPISHIERWGFVAIKGSSKGVNHNQQSTADLCASGVLACRAVAFGVGWSKIPDFERGLLYIKSTISSVDRRVKGEMIKNKRLKKTVEKLKLSLSKGQE